MFKVIPDFMIIGAMKCATSSLCNQLAQQPLLAMSEPKEPNFFSDDEEYAKGFDYYSGLFTDKPGAQLYGEGSTHYTKLPTYPQTVQRLQAYAPDVKFIYMMRDPIDRAVSHYIHEWTEGKVKAPLGEVLEKTPELVDYGRYSYQLRPYFEAFGRSQVLPVFFESFCVRPEQELLRIGRFLDLPDKLTPQVLQADNVSSQRMRQSPVRDALVNAPGLSQLRRYLVPQGVREWVKSWWRMSERPTLTPEQRAWLAEQFDPDLKQLGEWLGVPLSCQNYKATVTKRELNWR